MRRTNRGVFAAALVAGVVASSSPFGLTLSEGSESPIQQRAVRARVPNP